MVENLTFVGALRIGEAPRIVSGRDNDRCTLLIRLVAAICFSLEDAGVSGAGKKPRQDEPGTASGLKGNLSPDLAERDGERREPKVEVAASRREAALEPHEYAQSPVAKSRMLSASSDQGQSCCHFPSLLVGEESSESRLLILLMGKKPAKCFKEKCFTF